MELPQRMRKKLVLVVTSGVGRTWRWWRQVEERLSSFVHLELLFYHEHLLLSKTKKHLIKQPSL